MMAGRAESRTRRDLRAIMADGVACSVMIGLGENYLAAFALALGMGELIGGLISSIPLLAGALLQLVSPLAVRRLGSHRRWVVVCVACQAASLLPLAIAAAVGSIPVGLLFLLAALYWGSGMASGPVWSNWVDTLIPKRIRSRYFGRRARFGPGGDVGGFRGGRIVAAMRRVAGGAVDRVRDFVSRCGVVPFHFGGAAVEPKRARAAASGAAGAKIGDVIRRLRHEGDGRLLIYLWAMQAAAQVASPFFTPFMLGELKFSYAKFMLILSTSLLTKAIALPTLGLLAHRFGAGRLLWVGGLIVIPLPLLWTISQGLPVLLMIQVLAGIAWATYELAAFLLFFEAIEPRQRIGMLTLYNLGYAVATVGGSLVGGALLAAFNENFPGYMAVFAASCRALSHDPLAATRALAGPITPRGAVARAGRSSESRKCRSRANRPRRVISCRTRPPDVGNNAAARGCSPRKGSGADFAG